MKQPVKSTSVLLKYYYYVISTLALHPLFVSHMRDMPFGRKALHVSVRFVLHEALGLFLTCNLESVCLLRSVSSVPSITTRANFVVSRYRCPPKVLAEILPFKLLQYRRQRNPLRDSISSHFFLFFFSVAESFLWRCRMCTPTYIIDRCYYWSARAAHAK